MPACVIHISDLHRGKRAADESAEALVALCRELQPDLVIASGDLANRGRAAELATARTLLDRLPSPWLAVPGNHDIPYTVPGRFTSPWRAFEQAIGPIDPIFSSDRLVVCGLSSVRPWRHQGGRLSSVRLQRVAEVLGAAPPGALRTVALHHHLAAAPWRTSRKRPLEHRDAVLEALADAGAELVVGGHIHQSSVAERREFKVVGDAAARPLVLSTAPGFGRPRPHRGGEAEGLHVYHVTDGTIVVETRIWDGTAFAATARREFPRGRGVAAAQVPTT